MTVEDRDRTRIATDRHDDPGHNDLGDHLVKRVIEVHHEGTTRDREIRCIAEIESNRRPVIDDNYFCRAATITLAGRRARPEGTSDPSVPLRDRDGHRRAGQVAEAEANGRQEA